MARNKIQDGKTVDFTTTAVLSSGDAVIIGNQLGVALNDMAIGETNVAAMDDVYELPKVVASSILIGESVTFVTATNLIDNNAYVPVAGDLSLACTAWQTVGNGATTVWVKLNTGKGTLT